MELYLLIFFFAYLLLTMALPRWRVVRQTGQKVFVVPNDDSAQGFIGKVFRWLFLMVLVALLVNALVPSWKPYLLPAYFLDIVFVKWVGLILLHLSLLMIIIAQYQMNRSWRVGFDEKQKTELITTGAFRFSRNPIFLGMLMTMAGLFLVLPNALTFAVMLLAYVVLQVQVRLEEVYLRQAHGEDYLEYGRRVGRWF
ncbi:MAG: isoprenylcysteine carboxylmethyltransferase family protein [Lewinellaceae bacterium]|nr:isoprenylcysteine carboxylmethyltransferase family protein [Saprospiraceae bacterium]MCB9338768.1 isoprenylcysteine carboxylmethyltransferase family protein [Lewinellaceae bacterium]